jgi:uncharacterized membrane protein YoaK (UPF0700 family)
MAAHSLTPTAALSAATHGDGPLPPLLFALTFVTGLVDAASYLDLDHVFVANMTGNVVFLAFAIAGAPDLSIAASSIALIAFLAGALAGGRLGKSYGSHRGRHLAFALAVNVFVLGAAAVVAAVFPSADNARMHYVVVALLAFAMGLQNATSRRLAVPDLTTTVLTLTLTGLSADSRLAGGSSPRPVTRIAAVATMFAGALVGAALVLQVSAAAVIGVAFLVVVGAAITALLFWRSTEPWVLATR